MDKKTVAQLFDYVDGKLIWRVSMAPNAQKGQVAGCVCDRGYLVVRIKGKQYYQHRLVFLLFNGFVPSMIDHMDGDKTNNRIENLREATQAQNNRNSRKKHLSPSGVKGVTWRARDNRWQANIGVDNKLIHLGYFSDKAQATEAVNVARKKYHGEFACYE